MTCTYGCSHFRHFQNSCNRDGNTIFKYMNYVPIVVATDLEVHFSVLKKGVSQYFCLYSVCTSHWCLVMSFWLKVCIYSHTRGVKLGLGLGFMQTSQVLPHWLNRSFSLWTLPYTQRHCHVRIEKGPIVWRSDLLCFYCPSLSPSVLTWLWAIEYMSVVLFCYIWMLCYVMLCVKKKKKNVDNKKE